MSEEQRKLDTELAEEICDKYLNILSDAKQVTVENVKDDVDWIYQRLGKKSPEIIITTPKQLKKYVKEKYVAANEDAISFRMPIIKGREPFREALYEHNKDIPNDPFRRYMRTLQNIDMDFNDGPSVQSWFLYSEYLTKRYGLEFVDHEKYINFYNKVYAFQMFDDKIIIIQKPKIKMANGRLHSATGKSVAWEDGGFYHIKGILYEENLWKKIKDRTMPVMEIMELENIEQRYTAIEFYGAELVMKQLNAELVDKSPRGNELYSFKPKGEWRELKFLKYGCVSTSRLYMSFVPSNMRRADEAMAWKFEMTEEEYANLKIEA
jgi:hypothetical protein